MTESPQQPAQGGSASESPVGVELPGYWSSVLDRLWEAEQTLMAITSGSVDSLVIGSGGSQRLLEVGSEEGPYRSAAAMAEEGIVVLSAEGAIVSANPQFQRWIAGSPSELAGLSFDSLVAPANRAMVIDLLSLPGNAEARAEFSLKSAGGGTRMVGASLGRLDPEGAARALVMSDLTRLTATDDALARTRQRLQVLADNVPGIVIMVDPEWHVTWASPGVTPILGWLPEQIEGSRFESLLRPEYVASIADDPEAFFGSTSDSAEPTEYLLEVRGLGGEYRWLAGRGHRLPEESQGPGATVLGLQDVTDVVHTRERLRQITDAIEDVVVEVDGHRIITYASPSIARQLGRMPQEVVGRSVESLADEADAAAVRVLGNLPPPDGDPPAMDVRLRALDGTSTWWRLTERTSAAGSRDRSILVFARIEDLVGARQAADSERARRGAVVRAMLDPCMVFSVIDAGPSSGVDLVVIDANDTAASWYGVARSDLIGLSLDALPLKSPVWELRDAFRAQAGTEQPLTLYGYSCEGPPDGAQRLFNVRAANVGGALSVTWRELP